MVFAQNNYNIDAEAIKAQTGKTIKERLASCVSVIEEIKDNQILAGSGELLSGQDKSWAKNNLWQETTFLLKSYQSVLK